MRKTIISVAMLILGAAAFANHPCQNLENACKAAGYVKGEAKVGKGLFKDCMKPIMAGQSVPNVTVASADVSACQARKTASQGK